MTMNDTGTKNQTGTKSELTAALEVISAMMGRMSAMEERLDKMTTRVVEAKSSGGGTGGGGGRHTPIHVLDLHTGRVYRTQAEAGKTVAHEYPGLDPTNNFVWYAIVSGSKHNPPRDPNRFRTLSEEEYLAAAKNGMRMDIGDRAEIQDKPAVAVNPDPSAGVQVIMSTPPKPKK